MEPQDARFADTASRCPHIRPFEFSGFAFTADEVISTLEPLLRAERRERLCQCIDARTYTVVPVLEGQYDRGNISAVLRTAEALGFQAVHVVQSVRQYRRANRVTQGADKWLDVSVWKSTAPCIEALRAMGYRIIAAHLDGARAIGSFSWDQPSAIFFGNEMSGVSRELLAQADARMAIPMPGLVQSFNVSVAGAITLYHIYRERVERLGRQGDLTDHEKRCLTAEFYLRSLPMGRKVLVETRRAAISDNP